MQKKYLLLIVLLMGIQLGLSLICHAQESMQLALHPGYHLINSDNFSESETVSQVNWVFGGDISYRSAYNHIPYELSIGYNWGKSHIYTLVSTSEIGNPPKYKVYARYQVLPLNIMWIHPVSPSLELMAGINITSQFRTMIFDDLPISNDRLYSLGAGLTGKVHWSIIQLNDNKGSLFLDLSLRYTEFLIHQARGRNLDDFELRFVTVSPAIGMRVSLN